MRLATLALSLFCTTACATVTSIQTAPLGAGDLLHFRAPFDSVTAAVPSAVERAGPELRDAAQVDSATYRAIGTTGLGALFGGEVVRVLVQRRTDDAVAIRILSQSRSALFARPRDWTRSIYRELDRGLGSGSVTAVPGSRIRLFQLAPGAKPILGTLERWESDTLRLVAQASAGATAIPLTTLHRLQVSRGARGNARLGGVIGGLLGLAAGLVIGSASDCQQGFLEFCMEKALAPMGGMAIGGGLGAIVGASIRTDQWWEVRLPAAASPSRWR